MSVVRFLMLLSLVIWLGGVAFFPVMAQTSFSELPSSHLAGLVVRSSLLKLHWMAFGAGFLFLAASLTDNYVIIGRTRLFSLSHVLVALMLTLTAVSQIAIIPRMDALRLSIGELTALAADSPIRAQFDSLHAWSTGVEKAVLVLGLAVLYLTTRRLSSSRT
jgi:hypothetical protein